MTDSQAYLFFLLFLAAQIASLKKRWNLALFRGEGWFLGVQVPPGFREGPGRRLLRAFRAWLLAPYAIEVAAIAWILRYSHPQQLYKLALAMVLIVVVNSVVATRSIQKRARAYEIPGSRRPAEAVVLSLATRRVADYTHAWFEYLLGFVNVAAIATIVWTWRTAPGEETLFQFFRRPALLLYVQAGMLLAKRLLVAWRTVVPRDNADAYLEWREFSRRFWIDVCDAVRLLMAIVLGLAAVMIRMESVTIGFPATIVLLIGWMFWYRRHRDEYLARAARIRPAQIPTLDTEGGPSSMVCYRPQQPVLLVKGSNGYSLNLASGRTQMALLYLAGLLLLTVGPVFAQSGAIAGKWEGVVATRLRLVLNVEPAPEGAFKATLQSLDQGNAVVPVDFTFQDETVHVDIKAAGATFDGKLGKEGSELAGTFHQGGASLPLVFRKAGVAPKFALKPVTFGKIAFTPCFTRDGAGEALCGSYDVFENRQSRGGRKIAISIMVLPALNAKPAADPIFFFSGGPGESAVESGPLAGYTPLLQKERHVVLIDQRGTGKSNLLQCAVKDIRSLQSLVGEYFDLDKLRACRAELEQRADLAQYTTANFIDDVDEIRAAMGFDTVDVVGGSYGTEAALVYLRAYPDRVRSVVLKAVKPVQYKLPLTFAKTIQAAVERLLAEDPKLSADFHGILDRLEKGPAEIEVAGQKVTLSRGAFLSNMRILLYVPQLRTGLPKILHDASTNNWTSYVSVVAQITSQLEGVIARGMSFSVVCSEDVPAITEDEIKRETGGTWIGDYQVRFMQQACKLWPRGAMPEGFFEPVRSSKPVLLIAGTDDPATPVAAARDAAKTLSNSRVLEIPGGTHLTQSACIDNAIAKFVATADPKTVAGCQ